MKIKSVAVNRFRAYQRRVHIEIDDLTVLVGKNDIGKSTILEALDLFFNEGKGCVKKIDKGDINKECLAKEDDCIEIEVEFVELPATLVIDSTNHTNLREEYLLTSTGSLHIVKKFPGAGKEKVFIKANHPINPECGDLLHKRNSDLKKILEDAGLDCVDRTKNAELRKAIWQGQSVLEFADIEIEVAKIDAKSIWEQLKSYMPTYTLFQSDRKNTDTDDEVQDPMRIAVREILSEPEIQADLARVAMTIKSRLDEVSRRTLQKLRELNPAIANSLDPQLPELAALKWADVFKSVAITGDNDIPINKRGSGVKRLVLISFFRAEAEWRRSDSAYPDIVYAIEEPETSQHPEHQRNLIDALIALSQSSNAQVLLTTHSPEIVKRLQFNNILLVSDSHPEKICRILEHELPYPSLNEVNFVAFGEATAEYHNELYGFIDAEGRLDEYKNGKGTRDYYRICRNGSVALEQTILTEYVRHQIHHPENKENALFTNADLSQSIADMRTFLQG